MCDKCKCECENRDVSKEIQKALRELLDEKPEALLVCAKSGDEVHGVVMGNGGDLRNMVATTCADDTDFKEILRDGLTAVIVNELSGK